LVAEELADLLETAGIRSVADALADAEENGVQVAGCIGDCSSLTGGISIEEGMAPILTPGGAVIRSAARAGAISSRRSGKCPVCTGAARTCP